MASRSPSPLREEFMRKALLGLLVAPAADAPAALMRPRGRGFA
jgi:hypothetical protein